MDRFSGAVALGLVLLCLSAAGELAPPERSYKILMLLPSSSKSHRNVFMPLATALTKRGHTITMLSNHPAPDKNPSITYVEHGLTHFDESSMNVFASINDSSQIFTQLQDRLFKMARDIYKVPAVKELYKKRKDFDLVVINDMFNEAMYPFAYEHISMTISTGRLNPAQSAMMGNVQNPAYVSNMLDDYPHPFSFINRVKNIFFSIVVPITWNRSIKGLVETEISKQFPDLPLLSELERNQSLSLINGHFSLQQPVALLPNQVEIGGMHIGPAKPLPKEIEAFLSGTTPVVYLSLGSVAKSSTMPQNYKDIILAAFSKLPYKVIWKYEEEFQDLPKNILVRKWMPQQDVLAHPNVKVFITHCGMLGTQEAMYHKTPMLGMPIFGDQPKNAKVLEYSGIARVIEWKNLNEQLLIDTITELITNPSYRNKVEAMSAAYRDQITTPVERAVYWTEYIIRHQGALHLRSPEMDLSWVQFLHLDVLLALHLALYAVYVLVKKTLSLCFGSKGSKQNKNNRNKSKKDQ